MADADGDLLDSVAAQGDARELEEQEFMAALDTAVAELPERYRDVFELCVRNAQSYQTVAEALGVPTGTVAIRLMRARRRLFESLSRHLDRLRRPPACFQ